MVGDGVSTAQTRLLHRVSTTDQVTVIVSRDERTRTERTGRILDLAMYFDRVNSIELPPDETMLTVLEGAGTLTQVLSLARPVMTYKLRLTGSLAAEEPGPGISQPGAPGM